MHSNWWCREQLPDPGTNQAGQLQRMVAYDKGALPVIYLPNGHFCGNQRQWLEGSSVSTDPALIWTALGFSTCCLAGQNVVLREPVIGVLSQTISAEFPYFEPTPIGVVVALPSEEFPHFETTPIGVASGLVDLNDPQHIPSMPLGAVVSEWATDDIRSTKSVNVGVLFSELPLVNQQTSPLWLGVRAGPVSVGTGPSVSASIAVGVEIAPVDPNPGTFSQNVPLGLKAGLGDTNSGRAGGQLTVGVKVGFPDNFGDHLVQSIKLGILNGMHDRGGTGVDEPVVIGVLVASMEPNPGSIVEDITIGIETAPMVVPFPWRFCPNFPPETIYAHFSGSVTGACDAIIPLEINRSLGLWDSGVVPYGIGSFRVTWGDFGNTTPEIEFDATYRAGPDTFACGPPIDWYANFTGVFTLYFATLCPLGGPPSIIVNESAV